VQALDDPRRLGQISGFLSVHFRNMGAYDQALASAERALALAGASEDAAGRSRANLYLGAAYWAQGHYLHAIECLRQTVAALHGAQRRERLGQTNLPSVQSLAFLAACHAELGMFEEGATFGQEGLQVAESVASPGSIMWALWGLGLVSLCRGNLPKSLPLLERAMAICQEADLRLFVPRMAAALGGAYTLAGRVADAAALLTTAMDLTMGPEMAGFRGLCGIALGEVHLRAGRLEDAYALVERTLMLVRAHHERGNEAYALRLLGEVGWPNVIPRTVCRSNPTTAELWAWPRSAACALSSPTVTSASASSTGERVIASRRRSTHHRHRDVPQDGHAILAGEGAGGGGWARVMIVR
jgi:tetratricopeptide (TPR) repeat protein